VSGADAGHADPGEFQRTVRDVYVPPGDAGFWQAAVRQHESRFLPVISQAVSEPTHLTIDVLYGDHEGGQLTVSRFVISPEGDGVWSAAAGRHWILEREDRQP
jgi:hypothetical protein